MELIITNDNCETITLTSDLVLEFIEGTTLEIISQFNCCDSLIVTIDNESEFITIIDNTITVDPSIFNFNTEGVFKDGIYSFTIKITFPDGGYKLEKNCYFVDCNTLCSINKTDLDKMLIHYGLTTSNNCGCDCDSMCELYKKLIEDYKNDCEC